MSRSGLSFGLSLNSSKSGKPKAASAKRKPFLGGDDDASDDDKSNSKTAKAVEIGELDGFESMSSSRQATNNPKKPKGKNAPPTEPPRLKAKKQPESVMFGDLSSQLSSRKHAEAAEELDETIYDYDNVYDSFKPQKRNPTDKEKAAERKPRYMSSLLAAASVRKRDALIAEEKKIAREREAEGEEFTGKEKFVTEAYRKQQEENRRIEEEEKRREEEEVRNNKSGGMSAFYKGLLNKGEERHREVMKAAEEKSKNGQATPTTTEQNDGGEGEEAKEKDATEAARAREINQKGGSVAINEEGQVVDKRQLLRGGLNVGAKKDAQAKREAVERREERREGHSQQSRTRFVGTGGKGAMRERQTRMLEQQLEAALKRSRDDEEEEREKVERETKSRKTEGEISSAKERYLARKRAEEEAKKKG